MVAIPSKNDTSPAAAKPSLRTRLRAWWEGYDLSSGNPQPEQAEPEKGRLAEAPGAKAGRTKPGAARGWTPERLATVQRLFGTGCSFPGGEPFIRELIKPLGLDETMSVVDLGAGLGTMARVIATETGAWVDAVEPNPLLAGEAGELATHAGLGKRAAVVKAPLVKCGIKPHSRDAIVSREAFYLVPDKAALYAEAKRLLKPAGQLLFIDFMRKSPDADGEALQAWAATEPSVPHLIDMDEARQMLLKLGFDVRIAEDVSTGHCRMVAEALRDFAQSLREGPVDPEEKEWLLWEADYWARRVAMLQSGAIGLYRVYACLPQEDQAKTQPGSALAAR